MNPDIAQGVAYELNGALLPGWRLRQLDGRFVVSPSPIDAVVLRDEVWRLARLIAYDNFVSIAKTAGGGYEVASRMASGSGFVVQFDPR